LFKPFVAPNGHEPRQGRSHRRDLLTVVDGIAEPSAGGGHPVHP